MTPTTTPPPTTTTPTTTTPMMTVGANTTTAVMNVTTSTAATTTTTQPTITSNATYTSPNFTASSSNPYKQPILIQNLTVGITFTLQVTTGRLSLHGSFCWNDSVGVNILNSTTTSEQYIFVDGSSLQDIQNKTFTNCPPKPTFGVQLDSDNPDQFYALVYGVSQSDSSGSLTVQGGNHPLPTTTAATPPSSQNPPAAASSGLSGGAIAGIVIGAILIVAVIIIGGVLIYRNTTKARSHSRGTYEVSGEGVYRST
uniref:Uncharacterized protein n=1 Tax=Plectus sambesii TaxID=2011161 RepID=A0A914UTM1_9BILA